MTEEYYGKESRFPIGHYLFGWFCDICHLEYDSNRMKYEDRHCASCGKRICSSCCNWFWLSPEKLDGLHICVDCIKNPNIHLLNFLYTYGMIEYYSEKCELLSEHLISIKRLI